MWTLFFQELRLGKVYRGRKEGNGTCETARASPPSRALCVHDDSVINIPISRLVYALCPKPSIKPRGRNFNISLTNPLVTVSHPYGISWQKLFSTTRDLSFFWAFVNTPWAKSWWREHLGIWNSPWIGERELRVVLAKEMTASWKHVHFWTGQRTDWH